MPVQHSNYPPAAVGLATQPHTDSTDAPWPPLGQTYTDDGGRWLVVDHGVSVSEQWLRAHTPNLLAQWQDSHDSPVREQIARRINDIGEMVQHAEFLDSIGEDDSALYRQELRDSFVDGPDADREVNAYQQRQRAAALAGEAQASRLWTEAAGFDVALGSRELAVAQTGSAPAFPEQSALARLDTLLARAAGHDVAAAATDTGMVISAQAIDPERSYQTRLDHLTGKGTPATAPLTSWVVGADSATAALSLLIDNERRGGGLDPVDAAALEEQLNQLETAMNPSPPGAAGPDATDAAEVHLPPSSADPAQRWAGIARQAAGPAVRDDLGWPGLAAGLDRADAAGWDVAEKLPGLVQQAQMPDRHPARELYYRLMNDCEAAMPAAPTVAAINGTTPAVSTDARQRHDQSLQQQSHTVGREGPGR